MDNKTMVYIEGYRGFANATERIEAELCEKFNCQMAIPHSIPPNLILNLNGLFNYSEQIFDQEKHNIFGIKPVRFYNLLDANNNEKDFYLGTKEDLENAEIATTISNVTKTQIEQKLKLNRKLEIIGFPIQDVCDLGWKRGLGLEFIMVGRVYSEYKNLDLVYKTLDVLKVPRETLVVAGPEKPQYGIHLHNISVPDLNELYNSARFTFCLSAFEGLGLSFIEACVCNSLPICINTNPMVEELGLLEFASDPNPLVIAANINHMYNHQDYYYDILKERRKEFLEKYTLGAVCGKIMNLYTEYKKKHE